MGHINHNNKPLGLSDIVGGAVVFYVLYTVAVKVAGMNGYGFLKGLLNEQRAFEMLASGMMFLVVWYFLGTYVINPFLAAYYQREEKTSGTVEENLKLNKEIEVLKKQIAAEIKAARVDGLARRDVRVKEAKSMSDEVILAEKNNSDSQIAKESDKLSELRISIYGSLDSEVEKLAEEFISKLSNFNSRTIH